MGQQQLLLTLLVTILVGIATLVALNSINKSRADSNLAAVRQDILTGLSHAQRYYFAPSDMGGGNRSFSNITIEDLVLDTLNENGNYTVSGNGNSITIEGNGEFTTTNLRAVGTLSGGDMSVTWTEIPGNGNGDNGNNGNGNGNNGNGNN